MIEMASFGPIRPVEPEIPSYIDWMAHTALGIFRVRGEHLRGVDNALKDYWNTAEGRREQKVKALSNALANWIHAKGPNWRKEDRNKPPERIVEALYNALNVHAKLTEKELAALKYMDDDRRQRLGQLFRGKEIVWKALNPAKDAKQAYTELMQGVSSKGPWAPSQDAVRDIKKIKERQAKEASLRVTHEVGKWTLARDLASPVIESGLGIDSITRGTLSSVASSNFGLSGLGQAPQAFHGMLHDLWGGMADPKEISGHLLSTIGVDATKLAGDIIPIVSNVFSGINVLIAWGKVGLAKYREYKINCQTGFIMPEGDIIEAFKALERLLARKVTSETIQAGVITTDFALRTALSFADLGAASSTAVGVASTLAKLLHKLYLLGREYGETRDARKLLERPDNLDSHLFAAYPLLGCYMLLGSNTSDLVNMVTWEAMREGAIRFGDLAWMEQVEWVKKNSIDVVLERAAELVYFSPFLVRDATTKQRMPVHALYGVGGFDKLGHKLSKANAIVDILRLGARAA
jgi:hypothetical protein